jgi:hypothetical protein
MAGHDPAKIKLAEPMLTGVNWQEAAKQTGAATGQTSANRFLGAYGWLSEKAL